MQTVDKVAVLKQFIFLEVLSFRNTISAKNKTHELFFVTQIPSQDDKGISY